ncbi:hypothetical protein KEM54_004490 [Ascosphaera aggregata]|nr:hypothetical protein KEM54_004490 [Ascosphaera aggregata]
MGREEEVIVTYHDRIALIRLNKPDRLNACTFDNYYDLGQCLREIDTKKDIYITVITGTGRYFSAGADVNTLRPDESFDPNDTDRRRAITRSFLVNNLDTTNSFNKHSKIIVFALNGPAVGLSAALIGFADFVYAAPHTFLLTPFASLGLVTEGAASLAMVQRLGLPKANEALIMGKKITCQELLQTGFVNRVFEADSGKVDDDQGFLAKVFHEIDDKLGVDLNQDSMLLIKELIRAPYRDAIDKANQMEVFAGLQRLWDAIPQEEFTKLATGQKRHKF